MSRVAQWCSGGQKQTSDMPRSTQGAVEVNGRLQIRQDQLKMSWFYTVHGPGKDPDGHIRQLLRLSTSNESSRNHVVQLHCSLAFASS